jgi:hypothetical protein
MNVLKLNFICVSFPNHREIVALLEETEIKKDEKTYHINVKGSVEDTSFYFLNIQDHSQKGTTKELKNWMMKDG